MTIIEQVKLALRVNHNLLDTEYERLIDTAKLELIRVGIAQEVVYTADKLIVNAIITYVKAELAENQQDRNGFMESFKYQIDNLRKSGAYNV